MEYPYPYVKAFSKVEHNTRKIIKDYDGMKVFTLKTTFLVFHIQGYRVLQNIEKRFQFLEKKKVLYL